jgi:hypothetical protein
LADAEAHGATDEPPHAPPPDLPPLEKLSRGQWITAWLYVCVLSGVYSQQNLLAPNLTAIQLEFGFTPAERDKKLGGARAARPRASEPAQPPVAAAAAVGRAGALRRRSARQRHATLEPSARATRMPLAPSLSAPALTARSHRRRDPQATLRSPCSSPQPAAR